MNNKDYRELQLTSTQLIFIFIAVLILGLVIFLLGVSVGKKQTQMVAETRIIPEERPTIKVEEKKEPVKEPEPQPEKKDRINKELESHQKVQEEVKKQPQEEVKRQPELPKNLYYIQLGAFGKRENALALADQYKKKGYNALVREPAPSDRVKLYKVWVGGYPTRAEAERISAKFAQESSTKERYLIVRE